ncbi:MAG: hypothetical protein WBS33_17870, partial [Verrucomicrobiia bacterium]
MKFPIFHSRFRLKLIVCGISVAVIAIGLGIFWTTHHTHDGIPAGPTAAATPVAGVAKVTREDLFK